MTQQDFQYRNIHGTVPQLDNTAGGLNNVIEPPVRYTVFASLRGGKRINAEKIVDGALGMTEGMLQLASGNLSYGLGKMLSSGIRGAAGAQLGQGSRADYEMGAVIGPDGEISFVDPDMGIIIGHDGSVSSHDSASGLTYNWSSGNTLMYNDTFKATTDLESGEISYNFDRFTY